MTIRTWRPTFSVPLGTRAPASFSGPLGTRPSPDFVISYDRHGEVASRYGDSIWNLEAYTEKGRGRLYLASWCDQPPSRKQQAELEEVRWLLFLLMYMHDGVPLSCANIQRYLMLLVALGRFSIDYSTSIPTILNTPSLLLAILDRMGGVTMVKTAAALLGHLMRIGAQTVGYPVLGGETVKSLKRIKRQHDKNVQQTAPFPSYIYSQLITRLTKEVSDFEVVSDTYLKLMEDCAANPAFGRSYERQWSLSKLTGSDFSAATRLPTFEELVEARGLRNYFSSKGLATNLKAAAKGLADVQMSCKLLLHLFSGMRDAEVSTLPYYCLEPVTRNGRVHYCIAGNTTKLNNGKFKRTRWVTSREGANAVQVAQAIASCLYSILGDCPRRETSRLNDYPLFLSTSYLPFTPNSPARTGRSKYKRGTLNLEISPRLRNRISPVIEEADLLELEQIDPFRPWRSQHDYQVGKMWRLATHQCRRSLALYASRSGLVSLPSLRRQLQHITEEMSSYYARGSSFARNFIGDDKEHFGLEYQRTHSEASALGYIASVLLSDERLFGAHGTWVELRRDGEPLALDDRSQTIKRFSRGELAWEETHLGGCTKSGPCDKKMVRSLVSCLDCSAAVIKLSKLNRLIRVQESFLGRLNPTSKMWLTEKADLDTLNAYKARIEPSSSAVEGTLCRTH